MDHGADQVIVAQIFKVIFCALFALEMMIWLLVRGIAFFHRLSNILDFLLAAATCLGVALGMGFWKIGVLRALRVLRVWRLAAKWRSLRELWLVLVGLGRAARALAYLLLVLLVVVFACGSTARALLKDVPPLTTACGDGARARLACIDVQEYFGSVSRSGLTLLQLLTLDRWASNVVRPLFESEPFVAFLLMVFVFVTTYSLLSIAVGILVWSTCELARSHSDHHTRVAEMEVEDLIQDLANFFDASLKIEERDMLDIRDLKDALEVPQVAAAFKQLDLPFTDPIKLFDYLDTFREEEISSRQLKKGLANLKKPTKRFDYAKLAASVSGSAEFCGRLERRSESLTSHVSEVAGKLRFAFGELNEHAAGDMVETWAPEVGLRRSGMMQAGPRVFKGRYTEG